MSESEHTGWIFLLSDSRDSNWGDVSTFYLDIVDDTNDEAILIDSDVWGTFQRRNMRPQKGDGIAFYHTSRARFPKNDPFARKPRISLIGTILDIEHNGRAVSHIKVLVHRQILETLRIRPIVRDSSTSHLFAACGMVQGSIASFYGVPPDIWNAFLQHIPTAYGPASISNNTPTATSILDPPARVSYTVTRVIRDTNKTRHLKRLYDYKCQICQYRISLLAGSFYVEVHHIRPLGGNHQGIDDENNMLVVCPNHHAMFDLGTPRFISTTQIDIESEAYNIISLHMLDTDNIRYHNEHIFGRNT